MGDTCSFDGGGGETVGLVLLATLVYITRVRVPKSFIFFFDFFSYRLRDPQVPSYSIMTQICQRCDRGGTKHTH